MGATMPDSQNDADRLAICTAHSRAMHAANGVGIQLGMWAGRGDYATCSDDTRDNAGGRALTALDQAITEITAVRDRLAEALRPTTELVPDVERDEAEDPPQYSISVEPEIIWTSAINPWGDSAQLITNVHYMANYRRDLAPDQMWPAPTLRIQLDYRAAGRATNDPIAGALADLIEIGPDGKVLVDILDPSYDLAPVQGRDVALVLQAVTDLRDTDNVVPTLLGHVAPNLSPHLNAVAREIVAAVHTSWPAAARERAEDILRRQPAGAVDAQTSLAELAAMISPVQGDCPNDPPCGHPGFVHDIETDGDPIPMCGDEHCTCGQPPVGYRRSLPMQVWQQGEVVPAGQAVMDRAGRLHPSDLDVNGREWVNHYGPVVAIDRTDPR